MMRNIFPKYAHLFLLFSLSICGFAADASGNLHPSACGWSLHSTSTQDWKSHAGNGTLQIHEGSLIADLPVNARCIWIVTTEPVWVYRYSELQITFRATGIENSPETPLLAIRPGSIGPVTPGAKNMENPLARAGDATLCPVPSELLDGEIHTISTTICPPIQTEQIDQIQLTLNTNEKPGRLEILDLSFIDPQMETQGKVLSCINLKPGIKTEDQNTWEFLAIPESNIKINSIAKESIPDTSDIRCTGIPFRLNNNQSVAVTSIEERGITGFPVKRKCSEVALLMGTYLVGADGGFRFKEREEILYPERLCVKKTYTDGSFEASFPYNLSANAYVVATTATVYTVPANPKKTLKRIDIEENMSYGQVFLFAASAWTEKNPHHQISQPVFPPNLKTTRKQQAQTTTPTIDRQGSRFHIENGNYRVEIETEPEFELISLFHKSLNKNLILDPAQLIDLRLGKTDAEPVSLRLSSHILDKNTLTMNLVPATQPEALQVCLEIEADTSTSLKMSLRIESGKDTESSFHLQFPDIAHTKISGKAAEDYYLFPRKRAALSNEPAHLTGAYSGEFPLQFIDLYSGAENCGLAIHTRDLRLVPKRFYLDKSETETSLGIDYSYHLPIDLKPGEVFETPATLIEFHDGDWHTPFHSYVSWTKEWYKPHKAARDRVRDIFICRRDYPIGGTGYLFDLAEERYTIPKLIEESREDLGGIDMVDISGWAYSETRGRVGAYRRYELGGKDELRRGIEESHRQGVPVGFYFEGYLIDPRTDIGKAKGESWQLISPNGSPKQWAGNDEMFMCPHHPEWQNFMAETLSAVAAETGVDAVYMDQYGFAGADKSCFASNHGHAPGALPIQGEHHMLEGIRKRIDNLDHPVALYTEQVPNDVSSQLVDAAFAYGMYGHENYVSPAKLNLARYAFPSFKIIELFHPGIDPKAAGSEDVRLCFFHGHALWLKGRARSWYSKECRDFIKRAYATYHEHIDAFTSDCVEPLIATEQRGIFANRFSAENEDIITLYNAHYHTVQDEFLTLNGNAQSVEMLWGIRDFTAKANDGSITVTGKFDPHEVACIAVKK